MEIRDKNLTIERYCNTTNCTDCLIVGYCNDIKGKWLSHEDVTIKAIKVLTENKKTYEKPELKVYDPVERPSHYTDGKIEVIDFIDDKGLGFCLGNAIKYIARAGKKDPTKEVEDLKKAKWYIERKIKKLEEVDND